MVASKVQPPSPTPLPSIFGGFVDVRSLVDINLLALLHQSLLVENNDLRTMVLDTMYVLMTRSAVPVTDSPLIAMRREAFTEHSLQGYQQVLDQIFSTMVVSSTGHLDINRDTYGVGKKFVMVPPLPKVKILITVHLRPRILRVTPPPLRTHPYTPLLPLPAPPIQHHPLPLDRNPNLHHLAQHSPLHKPSPYPRNPPRHPPPTLHRPSRRF